MPCALFALVGGAVTAQEAAPTAIRAARLIDGRGGLPLAPAVLLVERRTHVVAVPGDPLQDIREMERVRFVMKGGVVYRDELSRK